MIELPTGNSPVSEAVEPAPQVMELKNAELSVNLMTLSELEMAHILYAMDALKGNKTQVAKTLGISLKTLYNKLHLYGLMDK